jgi:RHS repeat-associated protein
VYDGMLVVQERDALNQPRTTYTRGRDLSGSLQGAGGIGGLLARTDNTALFAQPALAHVCYHADGNGNVTALVNPGQVLVGRYWYDPYGNVLAVVGAAAEANLYRFSSKEWHENSALVYYGFRYYSPSIQRWINRDPLADAAFRWRGGPHGDALARMQGLYEFLLNAPVGALDAFGLKIVVTGIQVCNRGREDNFHGSLAIDGQGYGFYPIYPTFCGVTCGPGKVDPDDIAGAKCSDVKLDDALFDIDCFKSCVKNTVKKDLAEPPTYSIYLNNCRQWRNNVIDHCKSECNTQGFWGGQMP